MDRRPVLGAVAAVLLGLMTMGCSSDEGSDPAAETLAPTTTSTPLAPLSKDDYLAQGNAICQEMQTAIDEIDAQYGPDGPQTPADLASGVEATADVVEGSLEDLRALPAPVGDEETLAQMHDIVEDMAGMMRQFAAAAEAADDAEMSRIGGQIDALASAVNPLYADYGLAVCAEQ
jgi:hypothetical protein